MKLLLVFVVALTAVGCHAIGLEELFEVEWLHFKVKHSKSYGHSTEENWRKKVFLDNSHYIAQHNLRHAKGESTFQMAMNEFGDLLHHEFIAVRNGLLRTGKTRHGIMFEEVSGDLPHHWDWRTKGVVTDVKNQGQCGSCWSFSTTGALEGALAIKTKNLVSLSEQNLVDCSTEYGNNGCNGGMMDNAFEYIKENHGIDSEESYPYTAQDGKCKYNPRNKGGSDRGFVDIPAGNETALAFALWKKGPVSVAIDASQRSFQFYHDGVYDEPECSSESLDHGVLAVGFGSDSDGEEFYIVKNSWDVVWGKKGYIYMSRNKENQCGIASSASYPLV